VDLQTLASVAEVLGATTIVGGAIFAVLQVREFRAQRKQAVAVEIARTFQSPELVRAFNLVRSLPDGISALDLRSRGPEYEDAALSVALTQETIALLIYERPASFEMVRELSRGLICVTYRKLEQWLVDVRAEQSQPSWGEWYQWLVEQLQHRAMEKESNPAYVARRDWRPRD
jgi:hypothetical protein